MEQDKDAHGHSAWLLYDNAGSDRRFHRSSSYHQGSLLIDCSDARLGAALDASTGCFGPVAV